MKKLIILFFLNALCYAISAQTNDFEYSYNYNGYHCTICV